MTAVNAEKYYSSMIGFDNESWNVRDRHMMETLKRLMEFHEKNAKGIVWEHNTHVGDARATNMSREGMVNTGQLARDEYDETRALHPLFLHPDKHKLPATYPFNL
ncbi:MAG: erythromycin esterase family protein [Ginsengibacter sp.]